MDCVSFDAVKATVKLGGASTALRYFIPIGYGILATSMSSSYSAPKYVRYLSMLANLGLRARRGVYKPQKDAVLEVGDLERPLTR